jgi:hypothetical protein
MRITSRSAAVPSAALVLAILFAPALRSQTSASADPKAISAIDGGLGPCTSDFTINDAAGAPVYDAKIRVHIAYGFMSLHKLDLEVGTNAAGKARFTGLPDKTKQGLFFQASAGGREGSAFVDPAKTCRAELTIALHTKSQ